MSDRSSKNDLYRITDPEADLFSDAMDCAVSAHHSYKHGVMHNAERSGALAVDGEKIARRGLAIAIKAYLEELGPAVETPAVASNERLSVSTIRSTLEDMRKHGLRGGLPQEEAFFLLAELDGLRARIASLKPPPQ